MVGEYARELGVRLRAIRQQQGLSLPGVEQKSDGRWKAAVVGSYERGNRAVTVLKLAELAQFYSLPLAELLPGGGRAGSAGSEPMPEVTLDLERLGEVEDPAAAPLSRYAASIQSIRGDYNGKVLSIRTEDLRTLAVIYDQPVRALADQFVGWGVLNSEAAALAAED